MLNWTTTFINNGENTLLIISRIFQSYSGVTRLSSESLEEAGFELSNLRALALHK